MSQRFEESKPIYQQLVERICHEIIRKELQAGDKLPSVRDKALEAQVNPNTIQRTYSELERSNIVETRRGQGTFVTENVIILDQLRNRLKEERIRTFIRDMEEMGYSHDEMLAGIQSYLEDLEALEETNEEGDVTHD